jgi:hypothetical protein
MAKDWTKDRIASLSLEQIKSLATNAQKKEEFEIVKMCEAELLARKPPPKQSRHVPEGFIKVERSHNARRLEKVFAEQLVELARKLEIRYNFSTEKARSLSLGTKRFKPHSLLSSKGKAKVGGAQRAGYVVFDRYISYRIKDNLFALIALLVSGEDHSTVQFQVVGPPEILKRAQPISELRSYLSDGESIGLTRFAEEFDNFQEAEDQFINLMEQVAPKHQR